MKHLLLAAVLMSAGSALAHGGWRGGGGWGNHGGGFHAARPAYSAPRNYYVAPRPVYVAPRPLYVAPPRVYVTPRPYYRPSYNSGYGYVPAPSVGFQLPFGAISLYIGAQPYFLSGGQFYVQSGQGYSVVNAPIGAVLSEVPPGATRQEINGSTYATANGAWFVWDGNQGAWVVVTCPY